MNKEIRWKQRFENFQKAFSQLQKGVAQKTLNDLEKQGIIQSFEFTFELAWKTLKDFLESKGEDVSFPRDVIKKAFQYQIIKNGEIWLDMLEKRNILSHSYDEKHAEEALFKITQSYFPEIQNLILFLSQQ